MFFADEHFYVDCVIMKYQTSNNQDEFELYIAAVQKAAGKDYKLMEEFVRLIFPG